MGTIRFDAFKTWYRAFFSINEIENSATLRWSFGAVLFFYFLTFQSWIGSTQTTIETAARGRAVCWPYFQDCYHLYFLQSLPEGYSQSIFYMFLYAVILAIIYFMWEKDWVWAHALITGLFVWKAFVIFVLSYLIAGPYDYYHLAFSIVLLFFPLKEFFLKLTFVLLYFLSAIPKFSPAWVMGDYFAALQTGLPIFPSFSIPFFTNLVIFMEVIGAWFLLSKQWLPQRIAFLFFVTFHLYSGIFVYYLYPSVSLPLLIILFGPMYHVSKIPFSRRSLPGWILIVLLFVFQMPGYVIPGDQKLTLEGNRFGMFMFEANHQCIATVRTFRTTDSKKITPSTQNYPCSGQVCLVSRSIYGEKGLEVTEERYETGAAWNRCDPYAQWIVLKQQCALDPTKERVSLTFDHSINGGPFYRIVDEEDVCTLMYEPFAHNEWIQIPPQAKIVGQPVKDEFRY